MDGKRRNQDPPRANRGNQNDLKEALNEVKAMIAEEQQNEEVANVTQGKIKFKVLRGEGDE